MKSLIGLLALALAAPTAMAEQAAKFGDIEVHYNAMPTSELQPDVAKNYKLERSQTRGLLTVSVLKKNQLGVGQPIKAEIEAHMVNQYSQLGNIDVREVQEGPAIYYLGEFRMSPPDTLKFTLSVTPQGSTKSYKVEFDRKVYP
jgi:hypothetical protein